MLDHLQQLVSIPNAADTSTCMLLLQLTLLYLGINRLVGNVPESWSDLITVSHCSLALAD